VTDDRLAELERSDNQDVRELVAEVKRLEALSLEAVCLLRAVRGGRRLGLRSYPVHPDIMTDIHRFLEETSLVAGPEGARVTAAQTLDCLAQRPTAQAILEGKGGEAE